jgi:hypothetical protein
MAMYVVGCKAGKRRSECDDGGLLDDGYNDNKE